MDIKISCIIPYHNEDPALLRDCVDSILRQDFADYEILIVNDGSDAAHTADLEEVCGRDSRIRILPGPGRGVSAARNVAMREARGEYVAFVDADDTVVPYYFSEAYRIAVEQAAAYVVGAERFTKDRALAIPRHSEPQVTVWSAERYRPAVIMVTERTEADGFFGRGPVARLIRRDLAAQVPFPEGMELGEDIIWNLDVLTHCDTVCMVSQIWYRYWKNPASASHRYNDDIIAASETHLTALAERIHWDDAREAEIYFLHMYEFLRRHIFGCYLGRKECPLSVRERARMFRALLAREPWNLYEGHMNPRDCDRRTRGKYRLVRSGALFRFWYFRQRFRGRSEG